MAHKGSWRLGIVLIGGLLGAATFVGAVIGYRAALGTNARGQVLMPFSAAAAFVAYTVRKPGSRRDVGLGFGLGAISATTVVFLTLAFPPFLTPSTRLATVVAHMKVIERDPAFRFVPSHSESTGDYRLESCGDSYQGPILERTYTSASATADEMLRELHDEFISHGWRFRPADSEWADRYDKDFGGWTGRVLMRGEGDHGAAIWIWNLGPDPCPFGPVWPIL